MEEYSLYCTNTVHTVLSTVAESRWTLDCSVHISEAYNGKTFRLKYIFKKVNEKNS